MSYRKAQVYCPVNEVFLPVEGAGVECLDICEDEQGRDVLTFICPECKQQHESLVRVF